MYNPTRRNRNIGTSVQGHGQNNKLEIPSPFRISKTFYERLGSYQKIEKVINGHPFTFVIEKTNAGSSHACSVEDIAKMIGYIPAEDYGEMKLIVLRQPKRKEILLSVVWGRLIYSYEFENGYFPAIILEAVDYNGKLKWPRKLTVDDQKELERLIADGHQFTADKRRYTCTYTPEAVRNTQLYRTLLHEFGHYVHYCRQEDYFSIPKSERETFAHQYADRLKEKLIAAQLIPFGRI